MSRMLASRNFHRLRKAPKPTCRGCRYRDDLHLIGIHMKNAAHSVAESISSLLVIKASNGALEIQA